MARKLIRDAVHGDIEISPLEVELIDTSEFQRLRGVRQLGTAYLVFPSAVHTRFEHSLGASWMAQRIIGVVRRNRTVSADEERMIRIAALLHDVTHIPFGHTLEDERRVLPRHDEDVERIDHFFRRSGIGKILAREGIQDEIVAILDGERGWMSDIVTGLVSADLLDYLRRDTYFCGLSQYYDSRIFESFVVDQERLVVNLEKHGVLRRDALSELVNLLRIRYTLSERVYYHHTKIASGAMISKAVELALGAGLDRAELRQLKDETLLWTLRNRFSQHAGIAYLLDSLESRQLYKSAIVFTTAIGREQQQSVFERYHRNIAARHQLEQTAAELAGIESHQVIVYCPSIGMALPESEVPVRWESGNILPLERNNEEIRILKEKHRELWRFLVLVDRGVVDPFLKAAEEILNELARQANLK